MKREEDIELPLVRWAEGEGWLVRKLHWGGRAGAPDRFFAKHGCAVFLEIKRPGRTPDPLQQLEIKRLRRAGLLAGCVDDLEKGQRFLNDAYASYHNS